jgi:DNA ligase-4
MGLPLSTRRSLLQRVLKPIPNQFELVKAIPVKTFEELIELFDYAI